MIIERPSFERRILGSLEANRIPVVPGACGTGRTSLLLRLARLIGEHRALYLDFAAAATTPESCLTSILKTSQLRPVEPVPAVTSARSAFDALTRFFDVTSSDGESPVTFLIDEVLDVRTFESFPGLRHVQRELIGRLATSPSRFVLTSRFTTRTHRWLRDAPARFEVVHVPPLDIQEVVSLALLFDGGRRDWAERIAPAVTALTAGRAGYVHLVVESLSTMGAPTDPVAALAALFAPAGRLTARCRESYEFRLHRARGYGALKAILGILAAHEPLNLTDIAHHLHRTPGSTKDYLSWLEDVDLVTCRSKRYSYEDPLLRLYVRLYGRPAPPTDDEIVREVQGYAQARLSQIVLRPAPEPAAMTAAESHSRRDSGIVEID
jgi:hypothetical protein